MDYYLLKFQREEIIRDMYENEYLYFKKIFDFKDSDRDNIKRNDPKEGNLINQQLTSLQLSKDGIDYINLKIAENGSAQHTAYDKNANKHICSLFFLEVKIDKKSNHIEYNKIDNRMIDFGEYALLIKDPRKLISMIESSLKKLGITKSLEYGTVNFYDKNTYNGKLNYFSKTKDHDYQREYRVLFDSTKLKGNNSEPIKLKLEGLKSISEVLKIEIR
ncbi:hypothetical protein EI427_11450 [Flammeovirga pectinis]|uniref:Uncharacterized protein n=1 Tax=Flammeovirga pectinis TaxID=2494373 RepID=A0A3S9P3P3_9BACT|nr:hypothetical protein [Flammeovirga pectinis]AZQ62826.1 hypothetical protein EI427_11450 [Flammeovirga pectinis]